MRLPALSHPQVEVSVGASTGLALFGGVLRWLFGQVASAESGRPE